MVLSPVTGNRGYWHSDCYFNSISECYYTVLIFAVALFLLFVFRRCEKIWLHVEMAASKENGNRPDFPQNNVPSFSSRLAPAERERVCGFQNASSLISDEACPSLQCFSSFSFPSRTSVFHLHSVSELTRRPACWTIVAPGANSAGQLLWSLAHGENLTGAWSMTS